MTFIELFLIAVGLSMDAFAVAVCKGLSARTFKLKNAAIVGAYFGIFQALMPLGGYLLASTFAEYIQAYDHWVAFGLLSFLGVRMIIGCFKKEDDECDCGCSSGEQKLGAKEMLPMAIATSIDAMAVGISFAFLNVSIIPAVSLIGVTTLALSMVGYKIGNVFGAKFKSRAEFIGGLILVGIGVKILIEHLVG